MLRPRPIVSFPGSGNETSLCLVIPHYCNSVGHTLLLSDKLLAMCTGWYNSVTPETPPVTMLISCIQIVKKGVGLRTLTNRQLQHEALPYLASSDPLRKPLLLLCSFGSWWLRILCAQTSATPPKFLCVES